jgi:hypothetical protein
VTAVHALENLQDVIMKEGPFDGIMGYSEGALVAGTLIMKEQELREKGEYTNNIKMALFFGGWPPLKDDLRGMMLADETDKTIPVPTIHVSE